MLYYEIVHINEKYIFVILENNYQAKYFLFKRL